MKNLTTLLVSLTAAAGLLACGDDNKPATDAPKAPDAFVPQDAAPPPAPPTLGVQVDRMGRPAVNTALNAVLDNDPPKTAKKDAYNAATDRTTWVAATVNPAGVDAVPYSANPKSVRAEFARSLAVFDALDQGLLPGAHTATPAGTTGPGEGCFNGALHNVPANSGYLTLATVLADDQLYVDTSKLTCNFYLSLEVEVATSGGIVHSQCGGRTPTHDVIDTSYSLLAAGLQGFDTALAPRFGDGVAAHTDVNNDTFPFLGTPH
ncbi:hypothetical protein BH11MYX3_BH11MYX3_17600 [soil metagenome]